MNTAREMFDLSLPDLGPYAIDFTKNGRFLLLGGRKGHLALMDTLRMDVQMEVWMFRHASYYTSLVNSSLACCTFAGIVVTASCGLLLDLCVEPSWHRKCRPHEFDTPQVQSQFSSVALAILL